jgi:hypothetical protein
VLGTFAGATDLHGEQAFYFEFGARPSDWDFLLGIHTFVLRSCTIVSFLIYLVTAKERAWMEDSWTEDGRRKAKQQLEGVGTRRKHS